LVDHHPPPPLDVAPRRRLARQLDAVEHDRSVDGTGQVEPLAHRTRRGEQSVGLGEVERFPHDVTLERAPLRSDGWRSGRPSARTRSVAPPSTGGPTGGATPPTAWPCSRR